jgi:hypothetical protein
VIVKGTLPAAAFVALAIFVGACGGGSDDKSSNDQPTVAGTSAPVQDDQGQTGKQGATVQSGGSTAPASGDKGSGSSKKATPSDKSSKKDTADTNPVSPQPTDTNTKKSAKKKSKEQVNRDLYKAGKQTCYIFGLEQIRKEYELTSHSPEAVARFYANLYEKANPVLIGPYYQGCLRGLTQRQARDKRLAQR